MPLVNDGAATFTISGRPAVGQTLSAVLAGDDPDGNGAFSYGWQSSTDGTTWIPVGSNSANYTVGASDEGKQLRVQVSYSDGQGFAEEVTTAAGTVPITPLPALAISATAADKAEGHGGSTPFTFTVRRTGSTSAASFARWAVTGSGSKPATGADFVGGALPAGTLTFAPGVTRQTISVNVAGDTLREADETFAVTLANPTGATISTGRATGIIRNDDLIGTARGERIRGTTRPEFIDGRGGQDVLTGGRGPDVFGFRPRESTITAPDRITDFTFGEDKMAILNRQGRAQPRPRRFTRAADNSTARSLQELAAAVFADADGRRRGNQALRANGAALVRSNNRAIRGTYLLINDRKAALSTRDDLLVNITGFKGSLPGLGRIDSSLVFQ